jgi:hypothetical protein
MTTSLGERIMHFYVTYEKASRRNKRASVLRKDRVDLARQERQQAHDAAHDTGRVRLKNPLIQLARDIRHGCLAAERAERHVDRVEVARARVPTEDLRVREV